MLLAVLVSGINAAWGDETTYIFTSKSWAATSGGDAANWTSGKDGGGFSNDGIQVTTSYTGANGTSPIEFTNVTKIVATYNTNKSAGAGSIVAKIGTNEQKSNTVGYSSGDGRSANYTTTFDYATPQSGSIKITVNTTTNSIYLVSVSITTATATPVTGVSLNKTETTLEVGDTETLTATVVPDGATNQNVSWSSDDEDVATVDSNGKITAVAEGSATITVTTEDGSYTATCAVTVNAASKTAVNMTGFSATSTTIVRGNTTGTSVTNDQSGWTAAYTYTSSDEDVATVDGNGVITAVAKGTATITCSLDVDPSDATYKAGTTTSMTVDITVTNPFHNVTFSSNGNTYSGPTSVEEGEAISLPAVNPGDVNGYSFVGWKAGTIDGTTDDEPEFVTSPVMDAADVTYYAVFARVEESYSESEIEKTQTLQYDTWTYEGSTTDKSTYRMFSTNSYIESASFDLSLLKKVTVYGAGSFGSISEAHKFTITAGGTEWASKTTTGTSSTTPNEMTSEVAVSGEGVVRVISNCGTAGSSGLRISGVDIYTKKRVLTATNYCTTVTSLPLPVITMADVEMTWGDNDKYVAPIATINEEAYGGAFTYTVDKDGLTVADDGKLTSSTPGTYVVTASIAATAEHQDASTTCTVTVGKQDVTLSFANGTVRKKTSDETYTQAATPTPAAYNGTIVYSKENESTSAGATVTSSTGAVAFSATGSVIVKATAPATGLYNSAEATYTILVQTDPEIDVENQTIAYGSTFTVDNSAITGGDITVTSSNPAIALVEGLVITPVAVGTTTITVATAESDTYVAGSTTFTLTVTAPTGATSSSGAKATVFYESFNDNNGIGGNDGTWNGSAGSTGTTSDKDGWNFANAYGAKQCIKFGTSSKKGSATTPLISFTEGIQYTLSFKAAAWNADKESTTLNISTTAGTLSKSNVTLVKGDWTLYNAALEATGSGKISFEAANESSNRFFLDEVLITCPITSTSVTTTGGIATYCYQYPLNLDGISGAKAYKVSEIDLEKEKVRLTQITGTIKGGVPFILMSNGGDDTFEIPLAESSSTVPASNLLVGTLAPTFVAQTSGDYTNFAYSKSNECFVKLGATGNTVPANRAYLPIDLGGGSVKAFSLSFDTETGINEIGSESGNTIFNLAGQRVSKAQKGLYIVNGKKVIIK